MKRTGALVLAITLGCAAAPPPQTSTATAPAAAPTPAPTVAAAPGQPAPATAARPSGPIVNPHQEANDQIMNAVLAKIAGRENEPAEQVFQNVQSMKGMPAGRFVRVMNMGYSRALGVACTHCHFGPDYSSDEKRPKRAAREMMAMNRMINERLRTLQNLEGKPEETFVNCTTCHRGQVDPNAGLR